MHGTTRREFGSLCVYLRAGQRGRYGWAGCPAGTEERRVPWYSMVVPRGPGVSPSEARREGCRRAPEVAGGGRVAPLACMRARGAQARCRRGAAAQPPGAPGAAQGTSHTCSQQNTSRECSCNAALEAATCGQPTHLLEVSANVLRAGHAACSPCCVLAVLRAGRAVEEWWRQR